MITIPEQNSICETQIPDGPLVVSQSMPEVQTVSLGIWFDAGSRDERPEQAGISHALEHMLFKGTETSDAQALSQRMDALGGQVNAFTTRERTCFHAHCLFEDWPEALGLLTEMLLSAAIPDDEWQRERDVIFSEMRMLDDSPEEWLMDQHMQALFPDQVVGLPTLGNEAALKQMKRHDLLTYLRENYRPPRMLVTAAGLVDHDSLVKSLAAFRWPKAGKETLRKQARRQHGLQCLSRDIEQAYMAASFPGIPASSGQRPVAWLANHFLGGSMSSLLFQEVREKRGLAYAIGSQLSSLSDTGEWSIHGATDPANLGECVSVIEEVLSRFGKEGVNPSQLSEAKRQIQIQIRMGMDSVEQNMFRLGARLDEQQVRPISYWLEAVQKVGYQQLNTWISERLSTSPLWSFCGPATCLKKLEIRLHP